ncbi:MAG: 3'-5' exonuclease, partial [Candidatus Cloacimonadaceae bacterium]|nr:3'-5' exonuclease [Candidatus Cloacimonadaceae bacterium]
QEFVRTMIMPAVESHPHETMAILCRKGRDLTDIQAILEDNGIRSIYQPSSTLPEHPKVAGLLHWLRYLAYRDWMDFLAFLRSDYVLLKPEPLKRVIDAISAFEGSDDIAKVLDLNVVAVAQYYYRSAQEPSALGIAEICEQIISKHPPQSILSERDYLNLHSFIRVARDFETQQSSGGKGIADFLNYLEENKKQEFLKQVAVEGADNLQLLTIHKSKGLQFDRVFVFYNLGSRHGTDIQKVKWYAQFAATDYKELKDFALTYHYDSLLGQSDFASLQADSERRSALEELNNLYVAFTRAKTKLHIYITFEGSKSWTEYLGDPKAKLSIPKLLCDAARTAIIGLGGEPAGEEYYRLKASVEEITGTDAPAKEETPSPVLASPQLASVLPKAEEEIILSEAPDARDKDWKKIWLVERHNLYGDLAHYYLSHIKRNLPEEHQFALRQCLSRYCNVLTQNGIMDYINKLKPALAKHPELFDPRWDKVFTEFGIHYHGKEYRLDRLMLSTAQKVALIVDYKTGGIHELDQLERYREALSALPVFARDDFRIEILYVKLQIN